MIENNVLDKLMNEATEYIPNGLLATVIGNHITGMGFIYSGSIREPHRDDISNNIAVSLNVELNGDDVEVLDSRNVMYCYINADKIDYILKPTDNSLYTMDNFSEVIRNTHFVPNTGKVWRDDTKLYLLKINLNSGLIGRFDPSTGRFKNQQINWKSSTPEEVVEHLLTKEYLADYFQNELSVLESYVDFATEDRISYKLESELI